MINNLKKTLVVLSIIIISLLFLIRFTFFRDPIANQVLKTMIKIDQQKIERYKNTGIVITEVMPETAAAQANLQSSQIIFSVNSQAINNPTQFVELIEENKGQTVTLEILKDNRLKNIALDVPLKPNPRTGYLGLVVTNR